jgi:uncharacterized protein (DUF1778 family)
MYAFKTYKIRDKSMPQLLVEKNQRLSLRIPARDKALLMRAASLQQVNLTEFVLRASVQTAQAAIEREERLQLSERDSLRVMELLEDPPAPNARLLAAAAALPDVSGARWSGMRRRSPGARIGRALIVAMTS